MQHQYDQPTGYPDSLERLIKAFMRFPGIGRKSSERMALSIIQSSLKEVEAIAQALLEAKQTVQFCSVCFALTDRPLCNICQDSKRNESIICVVENFKDVLHIEKAGIYRGKYHVLGGTISPLDGIGEEDLTIPQLIKRLEHHPVQELILALNPNTNGDITAMRIAQIVQEKQVRLSQLARGIPLGGDLEFADLPTITKSFTHRIPL